MFTHIRKPFPANAANSKRAGWSPLHNTHTAKPTLATEAAEHVANNVGEPLPSATRNYFEPRFGFDFSQVRIHADEEAATASRAVKAEAYTIGRHVVFGDQRYQPNTREGQLLLAHELTHVVQQRSGAQRLQRRLDDAPAQAGGRKSESSATERLLAVIADIEKVRADAQRGTANEASDAGGGQDGEASQLADFLARLRSVAAGADEKQKLAVLSAFSRDGIQRAEAQISNEGVTVREHGSERLAAKSLSVSSPRDSQEIEAERVAAAVMRGADAAVTQSTSEAVINRQAPQLAAAGFGILAFEAESTPATSWNPPGWVFLGVATVVAAVLIGTSVLMASAQAETLSAAEEEAIRAKQAGEPYDQATYNRARKKQIKNEKYEGERNKNKQRGGG